MSFFAELRRRHVIKVAITYVIAAWAIAQVAELFLEGFGAPSWVIKSVLFLLVLGFPLVLSLAWSFQVTPDGIRRDPVADEPEAHAIGVGRKFDFLIIALLLLVIGYLVVMHDWRGGIPAPDAADAPAVRTIAVLPFVNLSANPSNDYLSDGFADEILHNLRALQNLRVMGRTSSFSFREKNLDLRSIGKALGVANILEGSLRVSGQNLRISVQLVNAADGFQIWGETYDRKLADIFDVQSDIAEHIAEALQVELDLSANEKLATRPTQSLDAYTWFLRGHHLLQAPSPVNTWQAAKAFREAIGFDPSFASAHVHYALANIGLLGWGVEFDGDPMQEAEDALAIALDLDPRSSEARLGRALLQAYRNEWTEAEVEFEAALDFDPDNALAQREWSYLLYAILGRPGEAVALADRYLQTEPLDLFAIGTRALAVAQLGRLQEAESELQRSIRIDSGYAFSHYRLANLYSFFLNRRPESLQWYLKSYELDSQNIQPMVDASRVLLDLDSPDLSERWVLAAEQVSDGSPMGLFARYFLSRYRFDDARAEQTSLKLAESMQRPPEGYQYFMDFAWLRALHTGHPDLAMQVYERLFPELFSTQPEVNPWNHAASISLADLMLCCGDRSRAARLLDDSLSVLAETTDIYVHPARAAAHLLRGDAENGLAELQEAVESGWRREWWLLGRDPVFDPIRESPRFQALIARIGEEMTVQRQQLQNMDYASQLALAGLAADQQ